MDVFLGDQNKSLNKNGLGFNFIQKQKPIEHLNQSIMYGCFSTCDFYNRKGPLLHKYKLKKNGIPKNMIWVSKGIMLNKQGHNVKRVPKNASCMNMRNERARKVFQQINKNTSTLNLTKNMI